MRLIHAVLLVAAVAACGDAGPGPLAPRHASMPALGALARAPFQDALERIVPSLGRGAEVDGVRAALTAVMDDGSHASLYALDVALKQLIAAQPDAAMEADAIRLATIHR